MRGKNDGWSKQRERSKRVKQNQSNYLPFDSRTIVFMKDASFREMSVTSAL